MSFLSPIPSEHHCHSVVPFDWASVDQNPLRREDKLQLTSLLASKPREGKSAGLRDPGQYFQCSFDRVVRISWTRCNTYCFHGLSFLIQKRVVVESTQQVTLSF